MEDSPNKISRTRCTEVKSRSSTGRRAAVQDEDDLGIGGGSEEDNAWVEKKWENGQRNRLRSGSRSRPLPPKSTNGQSSNTAAT
jgi:hypothetical protein